MTSINKAIKKMGSGINKIKINKSVGTERFMKKPEMKGKMESHEELRGNYSKDKY